MPSGYAHYRFGKLAFHKLPKEAEIPVRHFRRLYDVGLQGPDLFFYYNPLQHTRMGALGSRFHALTGREFFERAAAQLKEEPSEGGLAYLFGVLGHYALDSACHPLVKSTAAEGQLGHVQIETEFDRFLLTKDGLLPPCRQSIAAHLRLTRGEYGTVARFYPPASVHVIRRSVQNMAVLNRILAAKHRKAVELAFSFGGDTARQMVMPSQADLGCSFMNAPLMERFDQALQRYPGMAAQLAAHLQENAPLGEDFTPAFG